MSENSREEAIENIVNIMEHGSRGPFDLCVELGKDHWVQKVGGNYPTREVPLANDAACEPLHHDYHDCIAWNPNWPLCVSHNSRRNLGRRERSALIFFSPAIFPIFVLLSLDQFQAVISQPLVQYFTLHHHPMISPLKWFILLLSVDLHLDQFVVHNSQCYFHALGLASARLHPGRRPRELERDDDAKEGKQKVTTLHISISTHVIKWRAD